VPKLKADLEDGAYPQSAITKRIEVRARERGFPEGKQIAGLVDAKGNWWTRRAGDNAKTPLTVPEVSTLAEKLEGDIGWPWLDAYHMRALARGLAELAKDAAVGPSRTSPKTAQTERPLRKGRKA
jgi:hypothetical protein